MMLLIPCDPLDPRRPDEHFAPEAAAARTAGISVGLVDHDALAAGRAADGVRPLRAAALEGADLADAVYRGWMLDAGAYAGMARALAGRGVTLRTSPERYRAAHELPGWADALSSLTPATEWTDGFDMDALDDAAARLGAGPAVLRDHVKSLKHHWEQACYVPDAADASATRTVARRFLELRGEEATGGFVLRRFERFVSAEVRTWWVAGRCALATAHPDTPDDLPTADGPDAAPPAVLDGVGEVVDRLDLPFVTVDLVHRDDGAWRVVELGDGQVSDRPSSTDPAALIAALTG